MPCGHWLHRGLQKTDPKVFHLLKDQEAGNWLSITIVVFLHCPFGYFLNPTEGQKVLEQIPYHRIPVRALLRFCNPREKARAILLNLLFPYLPQAHWHYAMPVQNIFYHLFLCTA